MTDFLVCKWALPVYVKLFILQSCQVLLCRAALNIWLCMDTGCCSDTWTRGHRILTLLNFMMFTQAHTTTLSQAPSGWHFISPANQPLNLVSCEKLLRVHPIPSSVSLTKILNSVGCSMHPWGSPLNEFHLEMELLIVSHWTWPIPCPSIHQTHIFPNYRQGGWVQCAKGVTEAVADDICSSPTAL